MNGIIILVLFILIVALMATHVRIVPQSRAYVIERLGKYLGTWNVLSLIHI